MSQTGEGRRPRIWVPGVLWVSDEGELCPGVHAGWNGTGKAFAASKVGHAASLREWRHRAWMLERAALTDKLVERHAIILPETLLDPDEQPHARRWLAGQPLLCVSGAKVERLLEDGLRVYTVEMGVEGADTLLVGAEGGDRASWSLRARLHLLWPPELLPEGDPIEQLRQSEQLEVRTFIDRILVELSRGVLRELSVVNALAAYTLVEPGYGYHGATDGTAAPIEVVSHELRQLDALFGPIFERAKAQRSEAKELARDVLGAPTAAPAIEGLAVYGSARRVDLDEITIPMVEGCVLLRGTVEEPALVLRAQARWFVERVDMWRPKLPRNLDPPAATTVVEPPPPDKRIAVGLMVVLVIIIAVGYAMSH